MRGHSPDRASSATVTTLQSKCPKFISCLNKSVSSLPNKGVRPTIVPECCVPAIWSESQLSPGQPRGTACVGQQDSRQAIYQEALRFFCVQIRQAESSRQLRSMHYDFRCSAWALIDDGRDRPRAHGKIAFNAAQ